MGAITVQAQARSTPKMHGLVALVLLALGAETCMAFSGMSPLVSRIASGTRSSRAARWSAQIEPGSNVVVVGASSRVGRCVAQRLIQDGRYNVKLIASSTDGPEVGGSHNAQWYLGNMAQKDFGMGINLLEFSGEQGENGQSSGRIVPADFALRDAAAVIVADTTSTFPNGDWLVGRSPSDVDVRQVSNVVQCLGPKTQHVIFLSCMGAKRELPLLPKLDPNILFWVLDRFGALSAKRKGETMLLEAGKRLGFATTIVRPKLHCYEAGWAGGLPEEAFAELQYEGVRLIPGDLIDGETSDQTAAEALVQSLSQPVAQNRDFCVTNTRGTAPAGQPGWDALFQSLVGLEAELAESLR